VVAEFIKIAPFEIFQPSERCWSPRSSIYTQY